MRGSWGRQGNHEGDVTFWSVGPVLGYVKDSAGLERHRVLVVFLLSHAFVPVQCRLVSLDNP